MAHALYSQVELHADYGGVVPELASRDHVRKTLPLIKQTLAEANCQHNDITAHKELIELQYAILISIDDLSEAHVTPLLNPV